MPPKAKITKEMIVDTAFEIVRKEGTDKVTARNISEQLSCSTQPVLYYFSTVEDIKKAVYKKADEYHTNYLMNLEMTCKNPMLAIGINYIKFAIEEKHLFRFLFQSNEFSGVRMLDLLETEELLPIISMLQNELDISLAAAKEVFLSFVGRWLFLHIFKWILGETAMLKITFKSAISPKTLKNFLSFC